MLYSYASPAPPIHHRHDQRLDDAELSHQYEDRELSRPEIEPTAGQSHYVLFELRVFAHEQQSDRYCALTAAGVVIGPPQTRNMFAKSPPQFLESVAIDQNRTLLI